MNELITDHEFRLMHLVMKVRDALFPYIGKRVETFGIKQGAIVVDYGCGPGRYSVEFARAVGERGRVFAVDLKEIALREVQKKAQQKALTNIELRLAKGYESGLDNEMADMVFALDMFHMVKQPIPFLRELSRICKREGLLVIDDGHQFRASTRKKLQQAGCWQIMNEGKDYLTCKKA
jgi:ubiquinone/menaquinone biosynthesis C-methylase UbiE